jgi:hypothetical protein
MKVTAAFLAILSIVFAAPKIAAAEHADIAGRVVDHTGAALGGVIVNLTRAGEREAAVTTQTSATGEYRLMAVKPGRYRLAFTHVGFAEHSQDAIEVSPGAALEIDVTLHVALTTEVTVTARSTFRNLAELEQPASHLVGFAGSASEGIVTGRQLERRSILRSGEIVESVPGMAVTQHSGEGKANQFYLRGFNLDHGTDFSTTVAGVPVNLPSHAHGHGYTDTNFLIPELVTGVQYFKGPYAADAGDFSSAGGVHINYAGVLERPSARLGLGGDGWSRVFAAASPRMFGGHLLVAGERGRSDGPWDRPDEYRRTNGVVRYSRGGSAASAAVTAMAYRASWFATDQVPRRAVESGVLSRFGSLDATAGGDTSRTSISVDGQWSSATARSHVSAYALGYALDLFSNFTYFLDDGADGDQFHQADRRVVWGARASHERLAGWLGRPLKYRVGFQLRHDDIDRVGLYRTRARRHLSTIREDEVEQTAAGVWFDANLRWSPWLRAIAGIRVDGSRVRVRADLPGNSGRGAAGLASPKGSIVFGPWRGTELYVNAGFGFHSNDARGTTITIDPVTRSSVERVSPLARTRGMEIGARTVVLRNVQSTVAVWRLGLESELVFVGDAGTTSASRPSERYGIEWSTFWQLGRRLSVDADIAWSQASFTDDDPAEYHVPGAAQRVASLAVAYDSQRSAFGSLRWRHFGSRPLVEDNTVRSQPSNLVNAQMGYRLTDRVSLVFDLFNLLNAESSDIDYFYTSRLPREPVEGIADVHTHPSAPRSARVTLAVSF